MNDPDRPREAAPIPALADAPIEGGRLAENIMHFARALRAAGVHV